MKVNDKEVYEFTTRSTSTPIYFWFERGNVYIIHPDHSFYEKEDKLVKLIKAIMNTAGDKGNIENWRSIFIEIKKDELSDFLSTIEKAIVIEEL